MASKSLPNQPHTFHETKRYKRPLEVWPFEFEEFERLACATDELAELDMQRDQATFGHALKAISNRLLDLSSLWHERYLEQAAERDEPETGPDYFSKK